MRRTFVALGAILAMLLPIALGAHHSFVAEYDGSKPMNLVGYINKVDQQNPHGFFYVNVKDEKTGRITNWAMETPGPNQLVRTGFTKEMYSQMIDKKEMVTVKAYPARDGSKRAFAETITRADGRTVITISTGGVDIAVGRAPRGDAVTVDGVPVPDPTAPARGGGAGRGGQPAGAPAQGGAR